MLLIKIIAGLCALGLFLFSVENGNSEEDKYKLIMFIFIVISIYFIK